MEQRTVVQYGYATLDVASAGGFTVDVTTS